MPTPIKTILNELDEMIEAANPKGGGAPIGPIIGIGNLVNNKWPTIRKVLAAAAGQAERDHDASAD